MNDALGLVEAVIKSRIIIYPKSHLTLLILLLHNERNQSMINFTQF